ncbi:MAG: hypothetical protein H3C45_12130 [Bacteroidia bacterium]|nr:hypothetical protein [Bacteroidia bacterium]
MINVKPSYNFDRKYKTNFSKQWDLPEGITSDRLWALVNMWENSFTDEILVKILKPVVDEIININNSNIKPTDNYRDLLDILMGIASEFDEEDINEWLLFGGKLDRGKEYNRIYDKLFKKYDGLYWVPSYNKLAFLNNNYKEINGEIS